MTDKIITKDEAIERMKAGLPCETLFESSDGWCETMWRDFDFDTAPVFRKPPEPRRVAQERWIEGYNTVYIHPMPGAVHYREVLPGDVVCERKTEDECRAEFDEWAADASHDGFVSWPSWLASRRAMGAIR